ncbi:N-acetylneuraminate lyase [Enterococcus asini]|uniref:N-acetylneuraminate lyase n=1 Tax=Enterococcus asini TaxID=57732 RepID=UPI00288E2389|nr:N-acetylneuraminate lyase [Enterococcus asini]MDT2757631.1 N-acetylneuraminate lyase [Enterococcus asini]
MTKLISALLVPFDEQGALQEEGLKQVVEYNITVNKVDGLYVGGSTGENFMLDTATKKRIFKIVKETVGDRIDLIAQVGSLNIYEAKELADYVVNELGYKVISSVTPFYYKFDFEEIKNYYFEIVKDVDAEMIVYSIPALTGVDFSEEQFGELFANPKITGVKYTAGDFYLMERLRSRFPDKLMFSGFDEMLLPAAAVGIDGAIGSTFNVNAKRARGILDAMEAGDLAKARALQSETNDLIQKVLANGLYNTLKLMLTEKGVAMGNCHLPMKASSPEQVAVAKQLVKDFM